MKTIYKVKNLKKEQHECTEKVLFNEDVLAVLHTGYGKSLIYQLLPNVYEERAKILETYKQAREGIIPKQFWVVVVSPLEYLRKQQISNLERLDCAIKASSIHSIGDSEKFLWGLKEGGKRPLLARPHASPSPACLALARPHASPSPGFSGRRE